MGLPQEREYRGKLLAAQKLRYLSSRLPASRPQCTTKTLDVVQVIQTSSLSLSTFSSWAAILNRKYNPLTHQP